MPVRLVTTQADAVSAHALVIRMCEESGYKERPSTAAFTKMVMNNPDDVAFFLAEENKKPVGVTMLAKTISPYQAAPYGIFKSLYVIPEYRKTKVAENLFKALQQEAKKRNYALIEWHVYEDNLASLRFFEKQGFYPEERKIYTFDLPAKKIKAPK